MKTLKYLSLALLLAASSRSVAFATPVSSELFLLIDTSGSIDSTEFDLQRNGYAQAFKSAAVKNAIVAAPGGIAVAMAYWSGAGEQSLRISWTHLVTAADSEAFGDLILGAAGNRVFSGQTAVQSALNWAFPQFTGNGFEGDRLIIDISGDGADNNSPGGLNGKQNALNGGVNTINGLIILGESGLQTYYQNNVIGGANAFLHTATDFTTFADAITTKIAVEVQGVPEPTTWVLTGCGLIGLGMLRRRVKQA